MSFNKKWLPDFDKLIEEYERLGHDEFRKLYFKYDAFIGFTDEKKKFLDQVMIENKPWEKENDKWFNKIFNKLKTALTFIVK